VSGSDENRANQGAGRWQVFGAAIESWAKTLRLALLLFVSTGGAALLVWLAVNR
jgi:hypothetical protein